MLSKIGNISNAFLGVFLLHFPPKGELCRIMRDYAVCIPPPGVSHCHSHNPSLERPPEIYVGVGGGWWVSGGGGGAKTNIQLLPEFGESSVG